MPYDYDNPEQSSGTYYLRPTPGQNRRARDQERRSASSQDIEALADVLTEMYYGIGDVGYNMGSMMGKGSNRVSKMGGLAPSAFYNMDPNYDKYMNKTVRWEQEPNLWQMYTHPYDTERWGDYLPGSREEREYLADRGSNRFSDRNIAGTDAIQRVLDRMNQRRTGRR